MPQLRYLNCLLFVVHSEDHPDVWKPPAPPLDRTTVKETVKLYALLPGIRAQYPEEYEILRSSFASCSVSLINGDADCPFLLTSAIRDDRTEVVEVFFNMKDAEYERLIVKVETFNEQLVNALLDKPFLVEGVYSRYEINLPPPFSDYDSRSVLEEANHRIFELLVSFRADLRYRRETGGTLLHFAVLHKCEPLMQLLLRNGAQTEAKTLNGLTPLHEAIITISTPVSVVNLLVQHGANVNATVTESADATPLCLALHTRSCPPDVIKTLLDNGARKDDKCIVDYFQKLAVESNPECLEYYLSYRPNLSVEIKRETLRAVLEKAVWRKRTVEVLLKYGFDLVPEDARNMEVFFGAAKAGNLELVQKLINWGASVNARTENGFTPLHAALRENSAGEDLLRVFLDNGADINAKTNRGGTPLSLAISGKQEIVAYLLANGARVEDNPTILHEVVTRAWGKNCLEKLKLLLENGADVNGRNKEGKTPLSCAAIENNKEIINILSHYGAIIDLDDEIIKDALLCHIEEGRLDVLLTLVQKGANIEGIMEEALITAIVEGRQSIVRFLLEFRNPLTRTVDMSKILREAITLKSPDAVDDILMYGCLSLRSIAVNNVFEQIGNIYQNNDPITNYYPIDLRTDALDCADSVCCHISAVQAANLSINQEGVDYELPDYVLESESYYSQEDCHLQVAAMKSTMIGESGVSFFDFLNASAPRIIRYLKDESIVNVLKSGRYGDFPMYSEIIASLYRKAFRRLSLIKKAVKMMNFLSIPFRGLTLELKEIIINYLSNQNLLVLTNVCNLPTDSRP